MGKQLNFLRTFSVLFPSSFFFQFFFLFAPASSLVVFSCCFCVRLHFSLFSQFCFNNLFSPRDKRTTKFFFLKPLHFVKYVLLLSLVVVVISSHLVLIVDLFRANCSLLDVGGRERSKVGNKT